MDDVELPSEEELSRLGRELDCRYPASYMRFLRSPEVGVLEAFKRRFTEGWFVKSIDDIREFVDAEFTKDEMAPFFVRGQRKQMADITPYGSPSGLHFYGFDLRDDLYPELKEPPVVVFSIHTIVAAWRNFADFAEYIDDNAGWAPDRHGFLVRKDPDDPPLTEV